jgi:hypothetical protein
MISDALKREAREAFVAYERVFIERVVRRPEWRLVPDHHEQVLATGDEARVRAYIEDLHSSRRDLEQALIV